MEGAFALSFDTELIWGSFTHTSPARFERRYPDYRGTVRAILGLLERYEISATWAVVGHLFLDSCERGPDGAAHPEIERPRQSRYRRDWFADDPCTDVDRDPLWYGPDIVDAIQGCRVPQEIGSHSFSHPRIGDPAMTPEMVRSDLEACLQVAALRGIRLRSFVYPGNVEGHHDLLREYGFVAYRGADAARHRRLRGSVGRVARLVDQVVGAPPLVVRPAERLPGLWNIPGSAFLIHRAGARRMISQAARLRVVRTGLSRAERTGGVFHLWTHPLNIANDPRFMLSVLDSILREAIAARDAGRILIEPMGTIADRMAQAAMNRG